MILVEHYSRTAGQCLLFFAFHYCVARNNFYSVFFYRAGLNLAVKWVTSVDCLWSEADRFQSHDFPPVEVSRNHASWFTIQCFEMKTTIREQATKKPNFYLPMISLTILLLDVPARLVTFCLRFCQCSPLQNLSSPFYRICDNPQFSVAPGVIHPHQGQVA